MVLSWAAVGSALVTTFQSSVFSIKVSCSCCKIPPITETTSGRVFSFSLLKSNSSNLTFFFFSKTASASSSKPGAMMISKKILCIFSAVAKSTFLFKAITPPKIETESASYALSQASSRLSPRPMPHGFMCFIATTVGSSWNSRMQRSASSASLMLL